MEVFVQRRARQSGRRRFFAASLPNHRTWLVFPSWSIAPVVIAVVVVVIGSSRRSIFIFVSIPTRPATRSIVVIALLCVIPVIRCKLLAVSSDLDPINDPTDQSAKAKETA